MEIVLTAALSFSISFLVSFLLTCRSSRQKYFARGYSAGWNDHSACFSQQNHEEEAPK